MSRSLTAWVLLALALPFALIAPAQAEQGGGPLPVPTDRASSFIDTVHSQVLSTARSLGLRVAPDGRTGPRLAFPLRARPPAIAGSPYTIANFVDLDPTSPGIKDFACGQRTYDGHRGTDIALTDFAWTRMDNGDVEVVAAADGTIVARQDGNYDRDCSFNSPDTPNYFAIQMDDGNTAYYLHMKNGSLSPKTVGQRVSASEYLGLVGSSGISTGPHLHFEIRNGANQAIDPFAGACGAADTMWKHQWHAQVDPHLIGVATSNAQPQFAGACGPNISDNPHYADSFSPGDTVYGMVILRDLPAGQTAQIQFVRPDGSIALSGPTGTGNQLSYEFIWYYTYTLPANAPTGEWKVRGSFGNDELEHTFFVGSSPAASSIVAAILPGGRSVTPPSVATMFATIINSGSNPAYGCNIYNETPIDADFSFQTADSSNHLTGTPNRNADIPAGGAQQFVFALTPHAGTMVADAWKTRLRFKCTNAPGALVYEDVNAALISMDSAGVPDIIPIGVTQSGDGVVRLPGTSGSSAFATAATNIGVAGTLTVQPVITGGAHAVALVCETNPDASCKAAAAANVAHAFAPNSPATFSVFVNATGAIGFDPANVRVRLDFVDAGGIVRGQTSAALVTQ